MKRAFTIGVILLTALLGGAAGFYSALPQDGVAETYRNTYLDWAKRKMEAAGYSWAAEQEHATEQCKRAYANVQGNIEYACQSVLPANLPQPHGIEVLALWAQSYAKHFRKALVQGSQLFSITAVLLFAGLFFLRKEKIWMKGAGRDQHHRELRLLAELAAQAKNSLPRAASKGAEILPPIRTYREEQQLRIEALEAEIARLLAAREVTDQHLQALGQKWNDLQRRRQEFESAFVPVRNERGE